MVSPEVPPDAPPRAPAAGPPLRRVDVAGLVLAILGIGFPPLGLIVLLVAGHALRSARARQRRWALVAMTLGATSSVTSIGVLAWMAIVLEPSPVSPRSARGAAPRWVHGQAVKARPAEPPTDAHRIPMRDDVVRIGPEVRSLRDELAYQHAVAFEQNKTLLLVVDVSDCAPCDAALGAFATPKLAHVLSTARVVAASADHFAVELSATGIPVDAFPGFAVVGPGGEPEDYVNGGEWDDDTPANIAPVLESFVLGTYRSRRKRWRGIHDDETLL